MRWAPYRKEPIALDRLVPRARLELPLLDPSAEAVLAYLRPFVVSERSRGIPARSHTGESSPWGVLLLGQLKPGHREGARAPLGSVSDEKRLDGGSDGLRAFEKSVVARAGNDNELALWDRIGDRRR